ncbi:hypothetical protein [Novosphingobium acidiphilum]|jgi:hypothetical protein|uniref:hypothetical protein n=1 Tax=Novosphingobium acidiphilum TaxID=505248 RepID=UPI000418B9B3|nr:hypothetical protein [Novosphingobium acidiphilum]
MGLILSIALAAGSAVAPPPLAGGWTPVEAPMDDHEVRAAALALVRHLPLKTVGLRHIESASRQVVAGTNFRLTVRLTSGRLWRGTVWHKLNGAFVVTRMARLRADR